MKTVFSIESVNISKEKGIIKIPVEKATAVERHGLQGDAHAGPWHRQISLLAMEQIEAFDYKDRKLNPGEFAENLTTRGIDLKKVAVLDRVIIGDVQLEITQIGKKCHFGCAIYKEIGDCVMPREGLFSRTLSGGLLKPGMQAVHIPRSLKVMVITLSDRAYKGQYEDRSGPEAEKLVTSHYKEKRDRLMIKRIILPDDAVRLENQLKKALKQEQDFVITTGSTGIGRRDIAPEATSHFCDKLIPGIMEHARVKFGARKSGALLSRGVAAVRDDMVVINLPGSVKAVKEYLSEILPLWDHMRRMIHGIDAH